MTDDSNRLNLALNLAEHFDAHIAATAAYKAKCVEAGFSEHAAERMALEFHAVLMASVNP